MDVISLHKADLAAGHKKLSTLPPQSPEWWEVKDRLKKHEIAYSQAANMANDVANTEESFSHEMFLNKHLSFYQHLTAPYRPGKKKETNLPAGIVNLDNEIELPQTND